MATAVSGKQGGGVKEEKERCEHCGKWVVAQTLYTLHGTVNHPNCENVAICMPCFEKYEKKPDYWQTWIDSRFKAIEA